MTICKKELTELNDGKGGVLLRQTVDLRPALQMAEESKFTGNIVNKGRSSEKRILFRIPQELWSLDPTLKLAMLYDSVGDRAKYTAQIRKFMKENPKLCYEQEREFY